MLWWCGCDGAAGTDSLGVVIMLMVLTVQVVHEVEVFYEEQRPASITADNEVNARTYARFGNPAADASPPAGGGRIGATHVQQTGQALGAEVRQSSEERGVWSRSSHSFSALEFQVAYCKHKPTEWVAWGRRPH